MTSLIKTFYNNKLFHEYFKKYSSNHKKNIKEVRFTKVLTKYSTEYNNILFIYNLCQKLDTDKQDLLAIFQEIRLRNTSESDYFNEIEKMFENYNITKLDIRRMYRYLDKNIKKDVVIDLDDDFYEE
jgi:hypothetical protein